MRIRGRARGGHYERSRWVAGSRGGGERRRRGRRELTSNTWINVEHHRHRHRVRGREAAPHSFRRTGGRGDVAAVYRASSSCSQIDAPPHLESAHGRARRNSCTERLSQAPHTLHRAYFTPSRRVFSLVASSSSSSLDTSILATGVNGRDQIVDIFPARPDLSSSSGSSAGGSTLTLVVAPRG